jgi:uncharacterized membrane protein
MTLAERIADRVAAVIGSWRFIIIQSTLLAGWVLWNILSNEKFDEYPFILLNLMLSFQAAYTGPVLLMASNRQAQIDRRRAMKNLIIDQQDHEIIIRLERHIDRHFHELAARFGVPLTETPEDDRLCALCQSRQSHRDEGVTS